MSHCLKAVFDDGDDDDDDDDYGDDNDNCNVLYC